MRNLGTTSHFKHLFVCFLFEAIKKKNHLVMLFLLSSSKGITLDWNVAGALLEMLPKKNEVLKKD